jgi:hypothetical protein
MSASTAVRVIPLPRTALRRGTRVSGAAAVPDARSLRFSLFSRPCAGALALVIASCGGGGGSPAPGYTLTVATGLGTVTAGKSGSATLRLTPQNGYTGTVSLSCNVTGGSAASPSCALRAPSVAIDSAAVSVILTVSSSTSTPGGSYSVAVSARDTSG